MTIRYIGLDFESSVSTERGHSRQYRPRGNGVSEPITAQFVDGPMRGESMQLPALTYEIFVPMLVRLASGRRGRHQRPTGDEGTMNASFVKGVYWIVNDPHSHTTRTFDYEWKGLEV